MFTAARICTAIASTCTGVLMFTDATIIPPWLKVVIGAVGLFTGGVVSVSGPVQKSSPTAGDGK